ncbi:S24 family peptidase [Segatella oulorum]|uniref:S24 family peptidase n=1 Tax=Segatella oulorum TaxID=28136 RepID=UPI0028E2C946|nr:S24 family peptidase [Segatella oulorum]
MLKPTVEHEPTSAPQRAAVKVYPAKHVDDWHQGIPLIPFSAMAGALRGEIQVLEYECEHYIVPDFKTANFLITINGDSMLPTYKSGDIVACQREAMTSVFFQWNRPYVLDTAQGVILKRIKPGSDKEHILIVSDNPAYNPFELPLSEIYSVALVIGFIRLE